MELEFSSKKHKTLLEIFMEEIFILRHGQAEDLSSLNAKNDFDRRLTEEGKEKTQKLGLFFLKLSENIDLVLSSPYLRAKETAELFAKSLSPTPIIKTVDFLSCGASCKDISKGLLPYSSHKKIVLVGHSPDLELFLGKLIGADRIKLKKGSFAKVSLNNNIELAGDLEWLITPKLVKKFKPKQKSSNIENKV